MLNADAASIHSNLGNYKQGCLISTISEAQYNKTSTTPFVKPINPPTQPILADKATLAERENIPRIHKSDLYI